MTFLKTEPGDMVAIPTHDAKGRVGFVIGRNIDMWHGTPLFEVFARFYEVPPNSLAEVDITARLFRPIMMLLVFGKNSLPSEYKWRILFKDANYHRDQSNYQAIQIGYPNSGITEFDLWEGGTTRRVSEYEVNQVESPTLWMPNAISRRVAGHLAGLLGPTEQYSAWKIAEVTPEVDPEINLIPTLLAKAERAAEDSRIMAERFKQWAAEAKKATQKKKPKTTKNTNTA